MDLRHLRYFLTIAKEKQITRAAKKLNMAQPPLSQQLKQMEDELGVELIERNGRSIELTHAGKLFYKRAEGIINQMEDTMREIKETREGLRGELSLGAMRISATTFFSKKIYEFREKYPHVTYKIIGGDPFQIAKNLEERVIEIGIIRPPVKFEIDVNIKELKAEPYVLVIPKKWGEFNGRTSITLKELDDMPLMLIHRNNGEGAYEAIINNCLKVGVKPNIICECPDSFVLLSFVVTGIGATILPSSSLHFFPKEEIQVLDISDSELQAESLLIWSKKRMLSKVASRFIEEFSFVNKISK
ncbi:LysR family transcriptional regulator [Niallia oryzisoli]|uniref:LysR family transcriptional regulator n=1 Tax=Niallia oryzisoli TaxID=1737571 RepID=A0ABZ2CB36_9BACI